MLRPTSNAVMTKIQDVSLLFRYLVVFGIAFVVGGLVGPPEVHSQQPSSIVGTNGLLSFGSGTSSGVGRRNSTTTNQTFGRPNSIRSDQTSESMEIEEGSLTQGDAERVAAEQAIKGARESIVRAGELNPPMVPGKAFREIEQTLLDAETALDGRNFVLARQKALAAKQAVTELVPELRSEEGVLTEQSIGQELSLIEAAFAHEEVEPKISRVLRQFGYGIFGSPASTFAPVLDVPVGPEYTLGPDDTLRIRLWGLVDNDIEITVDREGKIFLPNVGTISLWGMSFKDAKALLRKRLGEYYKQFQADITLGSLRTIRVYVVGDVVQPGGYSMSSLSTVTNALYAAGGPKKSGSMRQVKLIRNDRTVGVVDLYDYLLRGSSQNDFSLQSGDTIFVPPIGSVVGVAGHVKRPAIYELRGSVRVSDALNMAGGVSPTAYLRRIQVERIKHHQEKVLLDLDLTGLALGDKDTNHDVRLQDGDFIKVSPIYARTYESVTVEGFVRHPGQYELKHGMRLSDIVTVDEIVPETNLDRGEVIRIDTETLRHEVIAFVPRLLFQNDRSQDTRLQPEDKIILYSEFRTPDTVSLGGEFKRPGNYTIEPGEVLSSVIRRAGGFTEEAYPKAGVFLRESIEERQQEQMTRMTSIQTQRMAVERAAFAAGAAATGIAADASAVSTDQAVRGERIVLQEAQAQVTLGRLVVNVDDPALLEGTVDDILLQGGDSFYVPPRPVSVAVLGSVRNPTALLHDAAQLVPYYIQRAGGFTMDADIEEMYILRADGDSVSGSIQRYVLEPGDAIIVPPKIEARIQPLPFWTSILSIVGNTAIGLSAIFLLFR